MILESVLPLAHTGHWLIWVLYAIPVVVVLGSIVVTVIRDRRGPPPAS